MIRKHAEWTKTNIQHTHTQTHYHIFSNAFIVPKSKSHKRVQRLSQSFANLIVCSLIYPLPQFCVCRSYLLSHSFRMNNRFAWFSAPFTESVEWKSEENRVNIISFWIRYMFPSYFHRKNCETLKFIFLPLFWIHNFQSFPYPIHSLPLAAPIFQLAKKIQ